MYPTRRDVLKRSAAVVGGVLAARLARPIAAYAGATDADPTTRVLSGDTSLASLVVPAGRTLRFDPRSTVTLEMTGNLIVCGRLEMKPEPGHVHTLRFVGVDESRYVGDTMDPVDSDVGLWVMDAGVLDILGQVKAPWNRNGAHSTWEHSDDIRVTPTRSGDSGSSGFVPFTPGSSVPRSSRSVPPAEVMNLTRTVSIEGTPSGRAHVFVRSSRPQSIRYAQLRYLGPRKQSPTARIGTHTILGRWMLHFHHCGDGSRGSIVEGVVARDGGAHAFVTHGSNGITFDSCIAYDTSEAQYWWDAGMPDDASHDVTYDRCVAALERVGDQDYAINRGFGAQSGSGNKMLGCVAVGGQAHNTGCGFEWPESAGNNAWIVDDCVSHNNVGRGYYFWHNTPATPPSPRRVANRFTAYRNVAGGVTQGAYTTQHDWTDLVVEGSCIGLEIDAIDVARGNTYLRPRIEACGTGIALRSAGPYASRAFEHVVDATISGCRTAVDVDCSTGRRFEFVRCLVDGADLEPSMIVRRRNAPAGSLLRSQRRDGTAWQMDLATGVCTAIPTFT
jgi:hypothetical protein